MLLGYDILLDNQLQAHLLGEKQHLDICPLIFFFSNVFDFSEKKSIWSPKYFPEINILPSLFAKPNSIDAWVLQRYVTICNILLKNWIALWEQL